jgi:tripartite-type tricarboxylate transporter receptor subunit TctC
VIGEINASVNQLLASKEMAPRMAQLKVVPTQESPAQLDSEARAWSQLIKDEAIKVD